MIRTRLAMPLLAVAATVGLTACGQGLPGAAAGGVPTVESSLALVAAADTSADATEAPAAGRCTAQQRWAALAEVAPQVESYLAAHPDVAAEIDHLRTLPVGQRRAEARAWIGAHPQYQDDVQALRARLAHYRATCTAG